MAKLLIFGATGKVGLALAPVLIARGHDVHGVTRSDLGIQTLEAAGITPVQGDMRDLASLEPKLPGFDGVFLACSDAVDQGAVETGVIQTIAKQSSAHIVKLSAQSAGLNPPVSFGVQHRQSELALQRCGLTYSILRPTFFQQSVLLMKDDIARKSVITAPMGTGRTAMVHVQDIADTAAECLTDPAHEGKVYTLTGPEPQSFADVASKLTDILGRKIKYTSPPAPIARVLMPFLTGMPRWQTSLIIDLMVAIKHGSQETVTDDVKRVTGHAPRALEVFLAENKAAFRPE